MRSQDQRFRASTLLLCLLVSLILACNSSCGGKKGGDDDEDGDKGPTQVEQPKDGTNDRWAAIKDKAGTGSILVKAEFGGAKVPEDDPIDMSSHKDCAEQHKGKPMFEERLTVNDDKSVPWVLVHVSKPQSLGAFETPDKAEVLDQKGCVYHPHVVGLVKGQPLFIRNSDPLSHNVNGSPKKTSTFNFSQSKGQATKKHVFEVAEMDVRVKCEVHKWMNARIHVLAHPWFAVTGEKDGTGELKHLKPGKYTLAAVHESFKAEPQEVEVKAGEQAKVTFKMSR